MALVLGYGLAIAMGLTLGLIGAGGSILTVPILVYFFDVAPALATGYSLLVVGVTALAGALRYWQQKRVDFKAAVIFAVPAMLAVFLMRRFVIHSLPDPVFSVGAFVMPLDVLVMLFFAALMLAAAFFMLMPRAPKPAAAQDRLSGLRVTKLVAGSGGIGVLTGLAGAGGGFLIIPTLIGLFGLEMKSAIGTSLLIIAINSLFGFSGDLIAGIPMDWSLLSLFLGFNIAGMALGIGLSKYVDGVQLRKAFGVFTLITGSAIILKELDILFG